MRVHPRVHPQSVLGVKFLDLDDVGVLGGRCGTGDPIQSAPGSRPDKLRTGPGCPTGGGTRLRHRIAVHSPRLIRQRNIVENDGVVPPSTRRRRRSSQPRGCQCGLWSAVTSREIGAYRTWRTAAAEHIALIFSNACTTPSVEPELRGGDTSRRRRRLLLARSVSCAETRMDRVAQDHPDHSHGCRVGQ